MLPNLWRSLARKIVEAADLTPAPPDTVPSDGPTPDEVFLDAAARYLDVQISTDDILDSRNVNIVWIGSTVPPLTFGLLSLGQVSVSDWAVVCLVFSLVCYLLLLVTSWWASHYRGLEYRPHLPTLDQYTDQYSGQTLQLWVALEYMDSTEANKESLLKKARWVGAANTLLYIEGFFISLAALLTLL